jgi:outer membrane protein OmpA-like peptidoglycan-associated protein
LIILFILLLLRNASFSSTKKQALPVSEAIQNQSTMAVAQDQSSLAIVQDQSAPTVVQANQAPVTVIDIQSPPATANSPVLSETYFTERTEILFVANSSALLPSAPRWIDETASVLSKYIEQHPDALFKVIGFVAAVYGPPDPGILSLERANKIVSELVTRNINKNKLRAISGGETDRWGNNIGETNKSLNRRILIQQEANNGEHNGY